MFLQSFAPDVFPSVLANVFSVGLGRRVFRRSRLMFFVRSRLVFFRRSGPIFRPFVSAEEKTVDLGRCFFRQSLRSFFFLGGLG